MQLQQEKQSAKSNLLRKCGLLAHTSAAFLKNCCTEKLFGCLRQKNCRQFDLAATSFDFVLLLFHLINFEQLVLLVQHLFSVLQLPDAFQPA